MLQAKLTGREEQALAVQSTNNPEAYDAYLRGLAYTLKTDNTAANALGAQKHLREAVRLDPNFALSWALLSYVDARGYLTRVFNRRWPSVKRHGGQPKPRSLFSLILAKLCMPWAITTTPV